MIGPLLAGRLAFLALPHIGGSADSATSLRECLTGPAGDWLSGLLPGRRATALRIRKDGRLVPLTIRVAHGNSDRRRPSAPHKTANVRWLLAAMAFLLGVVTLALLEAVEPPAANRPSVAISTAG